MADYVVVGGGPVGLWTAIQIKKRRPNADVQVYERYEEYQRSHVLRLESNSLLFYSKGGRDEHEKAFFKDITGKNLHRLTGGFQKVTGSVFVRTHDLEKALKTYAKNMGVNIAYETVTDPDAVMKKHPECHYFIAADGAHSRMRKALLGENGVDEYPLQYVVEVKYQADGRAGKLGALDESWKTNKLLSHMAFEYVGREKDGTTPVTLRFFLDKDTYDAMPTASFKDPLKLDDPRLPPKVAQDIRTYMNVRKAKAGENYSEGSAKISKLTLSMYAAKKFALQAEEGKNWFFVGDAAVGVPYFRALNSGLIVGAQLALILTRPVTAKTKVRAYNTMRPLDIATEFAVAAGKDMALKSYDKFRQMNAGALWQVNRWKDDEVAEFLEQADNDNPQPRQTMRKSTGRKFR